MIVDQPPLPPHERPWRHPSELGPTRHDVDDGGSGTWTFAVATGTVAVAVVAVAVMLVAVVPQRGGDPRAVSATTAPVAAIGVVRPDATAESARTRLVAVTRIPNAVSSAGLPTIDAFPAASAVPDDGDGVVVLTDDYTYRCHWAALQRLDLPDGSVVLDADGAVVGHVRDGELVVTVDAD